MFKNFTKPKNYCTFLTKFNKPPISTKRSKTAKTEQAAKDNKKAYCHIKKDIKIFGNTNHKDILNNKYIKQMFILIMI